MTVQAVVFDLGETLVDETRIYGAWADWLGVPWLTFFATLGGVIERREHHERVFERFRPGFDDAAERHARLAAGIADPFDLSDFYPDAIPCLAALREGGFRIGIAGNQPEWAVPALHGMGLDVDLIGSSATWGVSKPDPAFFRRIATELDLPPTAIAHVGDRVDNDVIPAAEAGMVSVFLRRGPWGMLQADWPEASQAAIRLDSLRDLPDALRQREAGPPGRLDSRP